MKNDRETTHLTIKLLGESEDVMSMSVPVRQKTRKGRYWWFVDLMTGGSLLFTTVAPALSMLVFLAGFSVSLLAICATGQQAHAATAFIETPPSWTDNESLVLCDGSGQPAPWCIRERRLYSSQTSINDVAPTPQAASRMQVLSLDRTTYCVDNVQRDLPIYASQAVVLWDNTLIVSLPNFFIRGNFIGWERDFINMAVVDGLDMMKLRTLFGRIPSNPRLTWADCPQVTGIDFPKYPRDEVELGDLNGDGIVDMLDIMIFRVLLYGLATQ